MGLDSGFEDPFEEKFGRHENRSDKLLYQYLDVRIFGPYHGDCHVYLSELKLALQEYGFESAKLCTDGVLSDGNWTDADAVQDIEEPPADYDLAEETYWWKKSRAFLEDADVCIFVFLDSMITRSELPDRAWTAAGKTPTDRERGPQEMNSSVVVELVDWLRNFDTERERTLVLFEESIHETFGSLVPGLVKLEGISNGVVDDYDVSEANRIAQNTCASWTIGVCRQELRERRALDTDEFQPDF